MPHYLIVCYIFNRTRQLPNWLVILSLGFIQQNPDSISTHEIVTHFKKLGYNPQAIENHLYEMWDLEHPWENMHRLKKEFLDQLKPFPKHLYA